MSGNGICSLVILWSVSSIFVGCRDSTISDECLNSEACKDGKCETMDPYLHAVVTHGCLHSGECPSGTVCDDQLGDAGNDDTGGCDGPDVDTDTDDTEKKSDSDTDTYPTIREHKCNQPNCVRPGPDDFRQKVCRIPSSNRDYRRSLIDGFGVDIFKIDRLSLETDQEDEIEETASFSWAGPKGTQVVSCMVFACPPEVLENDKRNRSIVNHETCVMAQSIQRGASGALELGTGGFKTIRCRPTVKVTHLFVGCLAYSDTELIGATRLSDLKVSDVNSWCPIVTSTCADSDDGLACDLNPEGDETDISVYGTCCGGYCLSRCVSPANCEGQDTSLETCDAGTLPGAELSEYVGVCNGKECIDCNNISSCNNSDEITGE